jgi:hypothetical protein
MDMFAVRWMLSRQLKIRVKPETLPAPAGRAEN